jgi:hypothetical protein
MANNNWNNYTEKNAALTDKDEIMLRDSTDGKNKRSPLSKIWNYMVDKMATAVISKLETDNKTIIGAINYLYGKTLINAYMGTGLQRDYVLNGMSTYIFFMSFVGDGSIVSTFFAVITTGDNASKTGKILWVGNSAENYVSLTDGVTLHLHITSSIWMQCALAKV